MIAVCIHAVHERYFNCTYIHLPVIKCDKISKIFSFCKFTWYLFWLLSALVRMMIITAGLRG